MRATILVVVALVASAVAVCPTVQYGSGTRFSANWFPAGQNIQINAGQTYLFDLASSPTYGSIYVNGGTLVFADEKSIELNSAYIMVRNGGKLIIGSCDCPFTNKAILTFWGTNTALNPDGFGTKGLAADTGGTILIYGQLFGPSWTTLGASAAKGATSITLSETVNWQPGDQIAISSSDYDPNQDEQVTVSTVSGSTVTFSPALLYGHYAATHFGMETRTHVARLTRNVVIRGDLAATTTSTKFGAHTMFANAFTEVRLSGIEITRAGQAGLLARYPVHFHFANDVSDRASVKDVAVHNAFQRCYTVHHTDGLLLQRNVGYNTFGHCFFMEDGIETGNKYYWNLGMVTAPPTDAQRLLPSDTDPAVFWITNPNNTWVGNAAAGGPAHCWWFALPVNPTGPSATDTVCPRRTPLGIFRYNSAHSCMQDCLHTDNGPDADGVPGGSALKFNWPDSNGNNYWSRVGSPYNPVASPTALDASDTPVEAVFESFSAWRCNNRGTWTRSGMVTYLRPSYADCAIGITFATNAFYGHMYEGTFIGETNNMGNPASWVVSGGNVGVDGRSVPGYNDPTFPLRGYEFYDGPNTASNIKCYNFKNNAKRVASCVSMLRQDQFSIAISNEAAGLQISDGSVPVNFPDRLHDGDRESIVIDLDGSITGRPPSGNQRAAIVNASPILKTSSCIDVSAAQGVYYCPAQYGVLDFDFNQSPSFYPNLASAQYLVKLTRSDLGGGVVQPVCGGSCNSPPNTDDKTLQASTSFQATIPLWKDIAMAFATSPPAAFGIRLLYVDAFYDTAKTIRNEAMVAVCYPPGATITSISYAYKSISPTADMATSLAALRTNAVNTDWSTRGKGMFYQDRSTGYIWLRMVPLDERTAANKRDGYPALDVSFQVSGAGSSPYNCPDISGGSASDRGLPPAASPAAPITYAPPSPSVPRDDTNACSAVPPPPLTAPPPPPPATPPPPPPQSTPPVAGATTWTVTVANADGFTFTPNSLNIYVGDTVQWVWAAANSRPHNVVGVADGASCVAGGSLTLMAAATTQTTGTYSFTFNTAGTFNYACMVGSHCSAGMRGVVIVQQNVATATTSNAATTAAVAAATTSVTAATSTSAIITSTTAVTTTAAITSNAATVAIASTTSASTTAAVTASATAATAAASTNAAITTATTAAASTSVASSSAAVTAGASASAASSTTTAAASTAATISAAASAMAASTTSVAETTAVAAAASNVASSTTIAASTTAALTIAATTSGAASAAGVAAASTTTVAASTSAAASTAASATASATSAASASATSASATSASASTTNSASTTSAAIAATSTVAASTTSASVSQAVTAAASTTAVAASLASVTGQSSTSSFASTAVVAAITSTTADASTNAALSTSISSTSAAASVSNSATTNSGANAATSSLASTTATLSASVDSITSTAAVATTSAASSTAATTASATTVDTTGAPASSAPHGHWRWYCLIETVVCLDVPAFFADLAQRLSLDRTLLIHDRYDGCEKRRQNSGVIHAYYETDYDGSVAAQIDAYLKSGQMAAVSGSSVSAVPLNPATSAPKKKTSLALPLTAIIVIAVVVGAIVVALLLLVIILAIKYHGRSKGIKNENPYYRAGGGLYGSDEFMLGGLYGPTAPNGTSNPLTQQSRSQRKNSTDSRSAPLLDYAL